MHAFHQYLVMYIFTPILLNTATSTFVVGAVCSGSMQSMLCAQANKFLYFRVNTVGDSKKKISVFRYSFIMQ